MDADDRVSSYSECLESEVASGLAEAEAFAETLNLDDVKSGQWLLALLQRVVQSYDRNARAAYFQQKYPGLDPDEIADILTSVTVRYATIAGGITGAAATANIIATLSSLGMTAALMVTAIGAEMFYLAHIQMRLVLDLSVVYDLQLDPDDPEDMLMIFGYALGLAPTELLGTGLARAVAGGTQYTVRKYVSKGTLKAIQDVARRLGIRILQRTIIKFTVPIASAAIGSSYNYVITKSVGRIAKRHLKNRGKVTDELRVLISRQNTYDIAFPAAAMYLAQVDGHYSQKEREFYHALLSRMSFDEHTQVEFRRLVDNEDNLLEALAGTEDEEIRVSLVEALVLMAIYDGKLAEDERSFLVTTAQHLNVSLDLDDVAQRSLDYRLAVEQSMFRKTVSAAQDATSKAVDVAGQAAGSVQDTAAAAAARAGSMLGKLRERRGVKQDEAVCANCGASVATRYAFCPTCGQPLAVEKRCVSCDQVIPADFAFCPHCGAPQG